MSYRADKLMIDARTDTHTHRQTQATTIPEGQYWPRVKRCDGQTDTDRRTDGQTENSIHRAAWSQLKKKNQGKSEGFDSCYRPSNLTQIGFKSSIFQPV